MTLRQNSLSTRPLLVGLLSATALLAGCTDNGTGDGADGGGDAAKVVGVDSGADTCKLDVTSAPSGSVVFSVKNSGDSVTEFYLYGEDGKEIVGEVENIGPGITRRLVVTVAPGTYITSCKPGMTGDGIRADFTVTDSGKAVGDTPLDALLTRATDSYTEYVETEVDQLVTGTEEFAAAYVGGDDDAARALYAPTRMHWERIEPVAESFGDLDPRLDLREADLEPGQDWTGWHRIEKDLWPPAGDATYVALGADERRTVADQLVADTKELASRVADLELTPDQLGNGAKELLDEVATGKVTGEEEIWSHTDLWDVQANVEGAYTAFEALEPALKTKDPELLETLDERFEELKDLLATYRDGEGFVGYDTLAPEQVKDLSDHVSALAEPLSKLTETVVL